MSNYRQRLKEIVSDLNHYLDSHMTRGSRDGVEPADDAAREAFEKRVKAQKERQLKSARQKIEGQSEPDFGAEQPDSPTATDDKDGDDEAKPWQRFGPAETGTTQPDETASTETTSSQDPSEMGPQGKLDYLENYMGDCKRCPLWKNRTNLVFGEGDAEAELVFVGEAPGYNEDQQGRPFVGKAGTLLDKMIQGMGLERKDVYIANILKSRPPKNRDPRSEEIRECVPFLYKQLEIIEPEVIATLGRFSSQQLLDENKALGRMRGRWHQWRDTPVMPTYHPAYLLRNPEDKRKAWQDLQMIMEKLGLTDEFS